MAELADPRNLLEMNLQQLEALGLARPASALISEYLAALVAEGLIDQAATEQIGTAYHRVHYGALVPDDSNLLEGISHLEAVRDKVLSLPDDARQQLIRRIQTRLQPEFLRDEPPTPIAPGNASRSEPSQKPSGPSVATLSAFDNPWLGDTKVSLLNESTFTASPQQGRLARWRSIRLEFIIVSGVALFLAGHFSRNSVDRLIRRSVTDRDSEFSPNAPTKIWGDNYFWVSNLRSRAWWEATNKHDQAAQHAYELLIIHSPRDAEALNNLAWLYLTSHSPRVRDQQRALELAQRALKLHRSATVLDTAAEAYYQTDNASEAVKLEEEAIGRARQHDYNRNLNFQHHLEAQLAKFRKGDHSLSSEAKLPARTPLPGKRSTKVGVL